MNAFTKYLDGWLYVGVAFCAAITASLGTDEAVKQLSPGALFYSKLFFGAIGAALLAGKMYRSTSFSEQKPAATKQLQQP